MYSSQKKKYPEGNALVSGLSPRHHLNFVKYAR